MVLLGANCKIGRQDRDRPIEMKVVKSYLPSANCSSHRTGAQRHGGDACIPLWDECAHSLLAVRERHSLRSCDENHISL
jgi:hypothetical protein